MSSSRRTEPPTIPTSTARTSTARRPAPRWRSPAGWSLRARLVATMMALLAILGLVVGITTEMALRNRLYKQLDARIDEGRPRAAFVLRDEFQQRSHGPPGQGQIGEHPPQQALGDPDNALIVRMGLEPQGGILKFDENGPDFTKLPNSVLATLTTIPTDGTIGTYDLGAIGEYRLTAERGGGPFSAVVVSGLPTEPVKKVLLQVAIVVGGVLLLMLGAAGIAGVMIVRRTLRPLSRVAATASRVSELRLDRGEVELAQRVPERDTDPRTEVGQVGAALNRLLDHVGNALERRHASEMQVRQFVADASHELRTPLAAIRGYAELSRRSRTPVPDEIAHVLRRVESEATRMTALVEDLLLLARLDAGRPLAHEPVDLTALVVDAVSDAHAAGPRHRWQLGLPEEPVIITGDGARLHQILANLLANARTHTPEGTAVTVEVGAPTVGGHALLRVTDAGPGIPADLLPHIFERFARGDSSRSRAAGSTGLGLSIVHAVVTAHGGTVSVDSVPGRTVFTVWLPQAWERPREPEPAPADPVEADLARAAR